MNAMMWDGYGMGAGYGIVGGLFTILWWALIIAGIVFLVRWLLRGEKPWEGMSAKTPLEILRERYAKGEIDKTKFEEMKKDLAS